MPRFSLILMDHFQSPRNMGPIESPDAIGESSLGGHAPHITIYLRIDDGKVTQASFETSGCGVAIAACSLLTVIVTNRAIADCLVLTANDLDAALGRVPAEKQYCNSLAMEALNAALGSLRT